jgi:predicted nucleic acid-binding protein
LAHLELRRSPEPEVETESAEFPALAVFDLIETTGEHVQRARSVQRMLAAKHQRGRKVAELLIAAAAQANGLTVLHYDADFDRISAATGQRSEWLPAGSVD